MKEFIYFYALSVFLDYSRHQVSNDGEEDASTQCPVVCYHEGRCGRLHGVCEEHHFWGAEGKGNIVVHIQTAKVSCSFLNG